MKQTTHFILLVIFLLVYGLVACDNGGDILTDEFDSNGCFPHETYDPETDSCVVEVSCEEDAECDVILDDLYADYGPVDLEPWHMEPEDCLPGEQYDPDEATCYIECDTEEECTELASEIYADLNVYFDTSFSCHNAVTGEYGPDGEEVDFFEDFPPIARYSFDNDLNLVLVEMDETADPFYTEQEQHEVLWTFIRRILPGNTIHDEVAEFQIFTDGPDATLAFVSPMPDDAFQWYMAFDIEDSGGEGNLGGEAGLDEFTHTIIHEFAHILTLENDQVPPDTTLTPEEVEEGYISEIEENCQTYYSGEGCANGNAYIALFFEAFWLDIYDDYLYVEEAESDDEYEDRLYDFYDEYYDYFVSEYAATSPAEDIAESFTFFVLNDRPPNETIADEKVLFFYQFPRLVQMRTYIRGQLARSVISSM